MLPVEANKNSGPASSTQSSDTATTGVLRLCMMEGFTCTGTLQTLQPPTPPHPRPLQTVTMSQGASGEIWAQEKWLLAGQGHWGPACDLWQDSVVPMMEDINSGWVYVCVCQRKTDPWVLLTPRGAVKFGSVISRRDGRQGRQWAKVRGIYMCMHLSFVPALQDWARLIISVY